MHLILDDKTQTNKCTAFKGKTIPLFLTRDTTKLKCNHLTEEKYILRSNQSCLIVGCFNRVFIFSLILDPVPFKIFSLMGEARNQTPHEELWVCSSKESVPIFRQNFLPPSPHSQKERNSVSEPP